MAEAAVEYSLQHQPSISLTARPSRISFRKDSEGRFLPRHEAPLDPQLVGPQAFKHPAVAKWWTWLREEYTPQSSVAIVTPCSNVKPYTKSPVSRRIRGLLRRLGLWDSKANKPRGIEWLYFSDLLVLVPYEKAEEYPACCYEVPPEIVLENPKLHSLVTDILAKVMFNLTARGLREVVVFLPRKHMRLWDEARRKSSRWPKEILVGYHIFEVRKRLEPVLYRFLGVDTP
ncbi:DUF5591 domain-containing protein [Hyperthermus butylicus]|uniref:Conserved crenarchaeal protein n=1 Tax=Hyperthermus butylicus (strain DSM 5456 / JCM 9403 / PLM1-5) TaxID=415426 RepID=A2BL11_HYPBU|nr:DUF5591 domain-containing protein [Hyperthermus butylicus]ABM80672.1 conserved crenarchaeal protein [Hyperthermus butylicus DSM 5456]